MQPKNGGEGRKWRELARTFTYKLYDLCHRIFISYGI